jgi:CBS-domain-containing membrane protein
MTGAGYWLILAPVVFALAIVLWLGLTFRGARRRRYAGRPEQPDRGAVAGGRIHGSPAQVNPRDETSRSR